MSTTTTDWRVSEPLVVDGETSVLYSLEKIPGVNPEKLARRPKTVRVLMENLLRHSDVSNADAAMLRALAHGDRTATAAEVRAALAWTQAPAIYVTILGVVIAILTPEAPAREPGAPPGIPWWSVVRVLLGFWIFVISLKTLGEVHRFSAWRALVAMILGNFALGIAVLLGIVAVMIGRGLV